MNRLLEMVGFSRAMNGMAFYEQPDPTVGVSTFTFSESEAKELRVAAAPVTGDGAAVDKLAFVVADSHLIKADATSEGGFSIVVPGLWVPYVKNLLQEAFMLTLQVKS